MKKKVKVAIIDNSIDPSVYTPVAHWKMNLNVSWQDFRAKEGRFPGLSSGFTHIILTGSEASITERETWVDREINFVMQAVEQGVPVLGSCWGHQLLAVAFAGKSHVRRSPKPEVGWLPITITQDDCLFGGTNLAYVFNSHFDEVMNLGSDFFTVSASSKDCPIHAFQLRGKPVWGIQSHPEINIAQAKTYLRNNIARQHEASPLFEQALKSCPRDSGVISRVIANFLRA